VEMLLATQTNMSPAKASFGAGIGKMQEKEKQKK
jgi:hypothetical protein